MYVSKTIEIHDPVNSDPQKSELENKNSVGSRPIAIYVARAPGQKRSKSEPLGSTASHPKGMLCVWGAWIGLGTDAIGGNPKGESQPYCKMLLFEFLCRQRDLGPDDGSNLRFLCKFAPWAYILAIYLGTEIRKIKIIDLMATGSGFRSRRV